MQGLDSVQAGDPEYNKWIEAISLYDRDFQKWEKRVDKILKIYRRETNGIVRNTPAKFNILWSNVQTLVPAVFSRVPKADVSRRFKDNDPVGRVASLLLERALDYEMESYPDFRTTLRQNVYDRFLGGRGTCWIRYEPHIRAQEVGEPPEGLEVGSETEEAAPVEELENESSPVDYVHWRDFGFTVGRTWDEVTAVWRRVYMTREAMVERFGEIGELVPLDSKPPDLRSNRPYGSDTMDARGLIYEIWDKETESALWISKSLGKILDQVEDPLKLPEFWPCPAPLHATMTSDSLVPIPDFVLYEDQARSLDTLADRMFGLIEALKVRGCYDASVPELARLFSEGDNNALIPVTNWAAFTEKQGLKGAIDLVDISMIGSTLEMAYQAFDQQKQQVYEIIGLSDIMRGTSAAEETLGAQQLKAHFGGNRLSDYQNQVASYASSIMKIKAHIICTQYSPETILRIGDAQQLSQEDQMLIPQALALLKDAPLRSFRIDIEADSMVQIDEQTDRQERIEFLGAMGGFLKEAVQAGQSTPQLAPLLTAMLEFGVRGFKIGKTLEGEIDNAMDKFKQLAMQPAPPNPEMLKIQGQMQIEQQKTQQTGQLKQQELQAQLQMQAQQNQMTLQLEQQKAQIEIQKAQAVQQAQAQQDAMSQHMEAQRAQMQAQQEFRLEQQRMASDERMGNMENQIKLLLAHIQRGTAIDVAEINAQTTIDAAQISASKAASDSQ
jgi:hypothetical protein